MEHLPLTGALAVLALLMGCGGGEPYSFRRNLAVDGHDGANTISSKRGGQAAAGLPHLRANSVPPVPFFGVLIIPHPV